MIHFFVSVLPVPKQSFRIGARGRSGFQPKRLTDYEKKIAQAAREAALDHEWRTARAGVPIGVRISFVFPHPKAAKKSLRDQRVFRTKRPDIDNLQKAVIDGLSRANLWEDDQQVATVRAFKFDGPRGSEGVEIRVEVRDDRME